MEAGTIQGYNSLPALPPLDRSELYQLWYRQELFDKKLIIRIGKVVPSLDFNNITKPLIFVDEDLSIPATTGLIYTPIFVNPTMLGVLPGYYDSACGITLTYIPVKSFQVSYGVYDGNLARGKTTGLRGPQFNGYYFHIAEIDYSWNVGSGKLPGNLGFGGWFQTGKLSTPSHKTVERGAQGVYFSALSCYGDDILAWTTSGIVGFVQGGLNNSKTLPMNRFFGTGMTFFGLIPGRLQDSFGWGLAWSTLNPRSFERKREQLWQSYYQMHLFSSVFFLGALSYIPDPRRGQRPL